MATNSSDDLLPRADSGESVRLSDLLASATYQKAVVIRTPDEGRLVVRNWNGYVVQRLNRNRAVCWHRRLEKYQVRNLAKRAVDAGGDVRIGDVQDELPKRYREIPSHLAPDGGGD